MENTEEVDAESIKDIQVVSDRIAAKLVFPGDPAKQRAYAGNALLRKKELEQYFNVSSSVIEAAKIAYREDAGSFIRSTQIMLWSDRHGESIRRALNLISMKRKRMSSPRLFTMMKKTL